MRNGLVYFLRLSLYRLQIHEIRLSPLSIKHVYQDWDFMRVYSIKISRDIKVFTIAFLTATTLLSHSISYSSTPETSVHNAVPKQDDKQAKMYQSQRQHYLNARRALKNKQKRSYESLKQRLANYPLLPYLEYQELLQSLPERPYQKVDHFLANNEDSYLGDLLLGQWLYVLSKQKRWHDYRSYYNTNITSTTKQCLYIWSRYKTGDSEALKETISLWNVGKSQPKSCDPLFGEWKKKGYLTEELIWDRYQKTAQRKKNRRLINYLKRLMSADSKLLAKKYELAIKRPERLKNIAEYSDKNPITNNIVHKGLLRYINKDSTAANNLWEKYQKILSFDATQKEAFYFKLAKRKAFDYEASAAKSLLNKLSPENQTTIIEIILREHLKNGKWNDFYTWVNLLSPEERSSDRWQYWQARFYEQINKSKTLYLPIYEKLANTRSYYGFLSADHLNKPYNLQDSPSIINLEILSELQKNKTVKRIRELYAIDRVNDARSEWKYITKDLTKEQFITLAKLANNWGWHRKSIESMAAATSWDDLAIRFPVAHQSIITQQAAETNLPPTLIFAIARQESAWEQDARSSAGAMGLMQLLPRTAKETAKKAGISYRRKDLLTPEKNIILGSRYISTLLNRYDNNRITAIAAYNAGPSRVNRWLKETEENLPHDVWVEVIPFNETRKYVQNVLSYAVVYAHQIGSSSPLLTEFEKKRPL